MFTATLYGSVEKAQAAQIDRLTRELAEARAEIDRLKAVAVPDGCVAVPVEPEEDLISDALSEASAGLAWHEDTDTDFPRDFTIAYFHTMLITRPAPEATNVE